MTVPIEAFVRPAISSYESSSTSRRTTTARCSGLREASALSRIARRSRLSSASPGTSAADGVVREEDSAAVWVPGKPWPRATKDHESDEEENVWGCNHCGKEFKRMILAIQHERRCTAKPPPRPAKKTGVCYRCGRASHYSNNCYAKTDADGNDLSDEEEDSD